MAASFDIDILVYVVTGVYGFLIIFLFAFVIHLFQKVQKLSKDDDDDDDDRSDIRSPPRQQQPNFALPKPMISKGKPHHNDLPEDHFYHNDEPERNFGHSKSPERSHGHSNFRNDRDFAGIDFNNRMAADKQFKPSSSQGGSYKNPLFDKGSNDLDNKYDYAGRDAQHSKPSSFKPPSINSGFNQPNTNHLYPRREYQNNNFRY